MCLSPPGYKLESWNFEYKIAYLSLDFFGIRLRVFLKNPRIFLKKCVEELKFWLFHNVFKAFSCSKFREVHFGPFCFKRKTRKIRRFQRICHLAKSEMLEKPKFRFQLKKPLNYSNLQIRMRFEYLWRFRNLYFNSSQLSQIVHLRPLKNMIS
jgi:hypothetical protein